MTNQQGQWECSPLHSSMGIFSKPDNSNKGGRSVSWAIYRWRFVGDASAVTRRVRNGNTNDLTNSGGPLARKKGDGVAEKALCAGWVTNLCNVCALTLIIPPPSTKNNGG